MIRPVRHRRWWTGILLGIIGIFGLTAYIMLRPAPSASRSPPAAGTPVATGGADAPGSRAVPRQGGLPPSPSRAIDGRVRSSEGSSTDGGAAPDDETALRLTPECEAKCGMACSMVGGEAQCPIACQTSDECESDELCTFSRHRADGTIATFCRKSECGGLDDEDTCPGAMQCMYSGNLTGGVYLCEPTGTRPRDAACLGSSSPDERCAPGLRCLSGVCLPVRCEHHEDCGRGARCSMMAGGGEERGCALWCERDDECATGSVCADLGNRKACISVDRLGCMVTGCRAPEECDVVDSRPWAFLAQCRVPCGSDGTCSGDSFCLSDEHCAARCSDSASCPTGTSCRRAAGHLWETAEYVCAPEREPLPSSPEPVR